MRIFDDYTRNLLHQFTVNQVEYIVVGGYAVNYYGYRRTTGDIDLWIRPDNGFNKQGILNSLRTLEVEEDMLTRLAALDFTKPVVFIDGDEPFKIDFMTYISGVGFEEAWQQKTLVNIDDLEIPFIHLSHLIISKMTSERLQDKIDVDKLQQLQQLKKG
jgi:predicted nucleotidyltransferase